MHVYGGGGLTCLVFLAAIPYVYWDRFAPPSVTVLDVGQADAILIRQGGTVALVDCGLDEARGWRRWFAITCTISMPSL